MSETYLLLRNEGSTTAPRWETIREFKTLNGARRRRQSLIDSQGWCDLDFRIDGKTSPSADRLRPAPRRVAQ